MNASRLAGPLTGRIARGALIVAGLLPFLPLLFEGVPLLAHVGAAVDGWFGFHCHREASRSLSLGGTVLPVCARCSGIYFGLGLGALVLRPRLGTWPLRIWVGLASVIMILDVATETLGMRPAWTPFRVLSGALLAYPVAVAVVLAARGEEDEAADDAGAREIRTRT